MMALVTYNVPPGYQKQTSTAALCSCDRQLRGAQKKLAGRVPQGAQLDHRCALAVLSPHTGLSRADERVFTRHSAHSMILPRLQAHRQPLLCSSRALSTSPAPPPTMLLSDPFVAPTDWFVYGHLHFILALPTLTLLYIAPPLQTAQPLQKQAAYAFVGFIVLVGVAQSYIWDAYGATLGIWEFNPAKCTFDLGESFPLPVEEVRSSTTCSYYHFCQIGAVQKR